MRVLFAGPANSRVLAHLREVENTVSQTRRRLHAAAPRVRRADFLVSHLYTHRVGPAVLGRFPGRAVNLHHGLLPWNRGLDSVLWSIVDGTPKGVTIHHMDAGIDTGDIIAQRELGLADTDTLRQAWARFETELLDLFRQHWPAIREGDCPATPQPPGGSRHFGHERSRIVGRLVNGRETTLAELAAGGPPE